MSDSSKKQRIAKSDLSKGADISLACAERYFEFFAARRWLPVRATTTTGKNAETTCVVCLWKGRVVAHFPHHIRTNQVSTSTTNPPHNKTTSIITDFSKKKINILFAQQTNESLIN